MPVQFPNKAFLWKWSGEATPPSPVPQNGYKKPDEEKGVSDVYRHTPCSNAWNNGNHRSETGLE